MHYFVLKLRFFLMGGISYLNEFLDQEFEMVLKMGSTKNKYVENEFR